MTQCGNRQRRIFQAAADLFFVQCYISGKLFFNKIFPLFIDIIFMLADCYRGRINILSRIDNYNGFRKAKAAVLPINRALKIELFFD
jgi:hypothetical protein